MTKISKAFVKRLINSTQKVYFRDIILNATGNKILKIDKNVIKLLLLIKKTFNKNLSNIRKTVKTNYTGRPNELSNYIETIVIKEINKLNGFKAKRPTVLNKGKQSSGYPDIFVEFGNTKFYLEVKTFQPKTKDSSLRSFYYKPSKNSKVTMSCPHVLIAFEVESAGGDNKSPFIINDFKIVDLYDLKVSLKPEFNASNIEVYRCTQV